MKYEWYYEKQTSTSWETWTLTPSNNKNKPLAWAWFSEREQIWIGDTSRRGFKFVRTNDIQAMKVALELLLI